MAFKEEENRRKYQREYCKNRFKHDPEFRAKHLEACSRTKQKRRLQAMSLLGGPKCSNCGCDQFEILEINHLEGGGNQKGTGDKCVAQILKGDRPLSEFNITCRVCNALHYVQSILSITGHTVSWEKNDE